MTVLFFFSIQARQKVTAGLEQGIPDVSFILTDA